MTRRLFLLASLTGIGLLAGCSGGSNPYSPGLVGGATPTPTPTPTPTVAPGGKQVIFSNNRSGGYQIYRRNADGTTTQLTSAPGESYAFDASPDGAKIVYEYTTDTTAQLFLMNGDSSGATPLTTTDTKSVQPSFSPDGSRIVFIRLTDRAATVDELGNKVAIVQIMTMKADGSDVQLLREGVGLYRPRYSPDGAKILFNDTPKQINHRLWIMNADGSGVRTVFDESTLFYGLESDWLPDGRVLYKYNAIFTDTFDSTGRLEVANTDGSGKQVLLNSPPALFRLRGANDTNHLVGTGYSAEIYLLNLTDGTKEILIPLESGGTVGSIDLLP